ncbi:hypothetical protein CC2G_013782 [Coprinopsis cinerea AmutBmut pab1-1]|nr:hypothetical protein CC2G_013782 [Coprinopsis cinerea AmutBmut pab1-1]
MSSAANTNAIPLETRFVCLAQYVPKPKSTTGRIHPYTQTGLEPKVPRQWAIVVTSTYLPSSPATSILQPPGLQWDNIAPTNLEGFEFQAFLSLGFVKIDQLDRFANVVKGTPRIPEFPTLDQDVGTGSMVDLEANKGSTIILDNDDRLWAYSALEKVVAEGFTDIILPSFNSLRMQFKDLAPKDPGAERLIQKLYDFIARMTFFIMIMFFSNALILGVSAVLYLYDKGPVRSKVPAIFSAASAVTSVIFFLLIRYATKVPHRVKDRR